MNPGAADLVVREGFRRRAVEGVDVDAIQQFRNARGDRPGCVLQNVARQRIELPIVHPADNRLKLVGRHRQVVAPHDHITAGDIYVVPQGHYNRLPRLFNFTVVGDDGADGRGKARGKNSDLFAGANGPRDNPSRVSTKIAIRSDHALDQKPEINQVPIPCDVRTFERMQQGLPVVSGHLRTSDGDIVALERRNWDERDVVDAQLPRKIGVLLRDLPENQLGVVDQVHLVHGNHQMRHLE